MTHTFSFSIESVNSLFFNSPKPGHAITVHSGLFHADDVCATAFLEILNEDFGWTQPEIIRTRNIDEARGVFIDVFEGPFDHHGAAAGVDEAGVPFSGFSRVFIHLVKENGLEGDRALQLFKQRVVDPVSKLDNGQALADGEFSMFSWVNAFNPGFGDDDVDRHFTMAVSAAKPIIRAAWSKAVQDAAGEKEFEHVLKLANLGHTVVEVPKGLDNIWPRALAGTKANFAIINADNTWFIQCVPQSETDLFSKKIPLPKRWAGLRGEDLAKESGLEEAVFCHVGRFIAGFKTRESAHLAATIAVVEDAAAFERGEDE